MKSIPLTENELKHIRETYELELERLQKRTSEISGILKKLKGISTEDIQVTEERTTKETNKPGRKPTLKKETKTEDQPAKSQEKVKGKRGRPAKTKTEQPAIVNEIATAELPTPKKRGRKPSITKDIKETIQASTSTKATRTKKSKAEAKPKKLKKKAVKAEQKTEPKKRGRKPSDDSKKARWSTSILDILNEQGKVLPSKEIINQVLKLQDIPASELQKARSIITGGLSELKLETKKIKTMSVPGKKGQLYGLSHWFNELGQLVDPSRLQ